MRSKISNIFIGLALIISVCILWSCSAESPFSEQEGTGELRLKTVVDNIVTRADDSDIYTEQQMLSDSCVVYISKAGAEKGKSLLYKYKGLENVPAAIRLNPGVYVAEAWSGDSVSASFDKKFYRGYEKFQIKNGDVKNVSLDCKIKNVVVSVNTSGSTALNANLMDLNSYTVVVKTKAGSLEFTNENAETAKGYFMLSKKDTIGGIKPSLEWEITGKRKDGERFSKSGVISNVEQAHHYLLNFEYKPGSSNDSEMGAAFIQLRIEDENLNNGSQTVVGPPSFSGLDFDIEKQQVCLEETVPETVVKVCGYGDFQSIYVTSESGSLGLPSTAENIIGHASLPAYSSAGLTWSEITKKSTTNLSTIYLTFSSEMLSKLSPTYEKEHKITITATDSRGFHASADLRIARNENAIETVDPIIIEAVEEGDWKAIKPTSVTLSATISDGLETTPGIEYRKAGTEENWTFVAANSAAKAPLHLTRGSAKISVTITGLTPATAYEYRAVCGEWISEETMNFTTDAPVFVIPNAGMEYWKEIQGVGESTKKILVPTSTDEHEFWGTGNPGAATMSKVLTSNVESPKSSGQYSAELKSMFCGVGTAGKFAAGNLFAGEYVKTDGTDGILSFGKPFNGSHPQSLDVWVKYTPGIAVSKKGANSDYIPKDAPDKGQIYWALTTEPIEIRTKSSNLKLFDKNDSAVLAYGQYTFDEEFGSSNGGLKHLSIPIEYYDRAKGKTPTYLVIVCSASKFGDYFCGGEGSTMYLDDFELVYE